MTWTHGQPGFPCADAEDFCAREAPLVALVDLAPEEIAKYSYMFPAIQSNQGPASDVPGAAIIAHARPTEAPSQATYTKYPYGLSPESFDDFLDYVIAKAKLVPLYSPNVEEKEFPVHLL